MSENKADAGSSHSKQHGRNPVPRLIEVVAITIPKLLPLAFGLTAMILLFIRLGSDRQWDIRHIRGIPTSAFVLSSVVYVVFLSSIVVVTVGAIFSLVDLRSLSARVVGAGQRFIAVAFVLAICQLVLILLAVIAWFMFRVAEPTEICVAQDLTDSFVFHDIMVLGIFALFTLIDLVVICGLTVAKSKAKADSASETNLAADIEWTKAQLWLIDLPVIIGSLGLLYFVDQIESSRLLMTFDPHIVELTKREMAVRIQVEPMANLICAGNRDIDIQRLIGNTFVAGLGSGSLAAQVILSQVVFMFLRLFYAVKREL